MKFLLVYDIAGQSTREVGEGMRQGLTHLGQEVRTVPFHNYLGYFLRDLNDFHKLNADQRGVIMGNLNKLMLADMIAYGPDVLLVVSGWGVAPILLEMFNKAVKRPVKRILYLTEAPYQDEEQSALLSGYDGILCNELASMDFYRQHHDNVAYMPHSYNPQIHYPQPKKIDSGIDVFFCATGFRERIKQLESMPWNGTQLFLAGLWPGVEDSSLSAYYSGLQQIPNMLLPQFYTNSRISVNIHRSSKVWTQGAEGQQYIDPKQADSCNPRVFEVLASQGLLLTDFRGEMDGWLRDGEECVTYSSPEEFADKIRFYLQHPEERERIAAAGRDAVQSCTFANRCENILFPLVRR